MFSSLLKSWKILTGVESFDLQTHQIKIVYFVMQFPVKFVNKYSVN